MSENELPAVAKRVLQDCKKCEAERFHIVIAHTSPTAAKVQCEVCGSKKTYKLPKVQERRSNRPKPAASKKPPSAGAHQKQYVDLKERFSGQSAANYTMKSNYKVDTVIEHPKFGVGFVVEVLNDKIHVAFSDEVKTLVHNRV